MADTLYDVQVYIPARDAPGMKVITDVIFDALAKHLDLDERTMSVIVKGPPEVSIGLVMR